MQLELYFAEQKTRSCYFMQINVLLHHVEFSIVFLKMINIYLIVTVSLVFIVWQLFKQYKKGKFKRKTTTEPVFRKCSANHCSVKEPLAHVFSCHNFNQNLWKKAILGHMSYCIICSLLEIFVLKYQVFSEFCDFSQMKILIYCQFPTFL